MNNTNHTHMEEWMQRYPSKCDEPRCVIPGRCYYQGKPTLCGLNLSKAHLSLPKETSGMEEWVKKHFPDYVQPHDNKHIWESSDWVTIERAATMVKVRLILWSDEQSLKIEFYRKGYYEWETAFEGWVADTDEIETVCRLIGLPVSAHPSAPQQQTEQEGYKKTAQFWMEKALLKTEEIAALQQQINDLRAWKESAISVWPDMQGIGRLLNVGLGQSIHDKIIPGIQALQSRVRELEQQLKQKAQGDYQKEADWIVSSLLRSACEGYQDAKIGGENRENFYALINTSQLKEWAESVVSHLSADAIHPDH